MRPHQYGNFTLIQIQTNIKSQKNKIKIKSDATKKVAIAPIQIYKTKSKKANIINSSTRGNLYGNAKSESKK